MGICGRATGTWQPAVQHHGESGTMAGVVTPPSRASKTIAENRVNEARDFVTWSSSERPKQGQANKRHQVQRPREVRRRIGRFTLPSKRQRV